jgi:hypothetical protein
MYTYTKNDLHQLKNLLVSRATNQFNQYRNEHELYRRCGVDHMSLAAGQLKGVAIQAKVWIEDIMPAIHSNVGNLIENGEEAIKVLGRLKAWEHQIESELETFEGVVRQLTVPNSVLVAADAFNARQVAPATPPYQAEPEDTAAIKLQLVQGGRR